MKKVVVLITVIVMLFMITSCEEKVECDFCGEEKVCEEREIWDETIYICEDCLDELS